MSDIARELIAHKEYWGSAVDNPEWEKAGRVHDWRNHVPEKVKKAWPELGFEARAVAFFMADEEAGREEWD